MDSNRELPENDDSFLVSKEWFSGSDKIFANKVGRDRFMLSTDPLQMSHAFGFVRDGNIYEAISQIIAKSWDGTMAIEDEYGRRELYFSRGELVFASTGSIDDRLGEILYRNATIELDALTHCAAQVHRKMKFGQVLLQEKILEHFELWNALSSQVVQIARTVFYCSEGFYELNNGARPWIELSLGNTNHLMEDLYFYGITYRQFLASVDQQSKVELTAGTEWKEQYHPSSFTGEFIRLIEDADTVAELVDKCKLKKFNTLAIMHSLHNDGLLRIESVATKPLDWPSDPLLSQLRGVLDLYEIVLDIVRGLFADENRRLSVDQLSVFADSIRGQESSVIIYVDERGRIPKRVLEAIHIQCLKGLPRVKMYCEKVSALLRFLLQLAMDQLGTESRELLINKYRDLQ